MLRITGLAAIASLSTVLAFAAEPRQGKSALPQITVYKDPNCRCCTAWADHLRKHAFTDDEGHLGPRVGQEVGSRPR